MYGEELLPYHHPPAQYTGELFGIHYLYQQSIPELPHTDELSYDEGEDEINEETCAADTTSESLEAVGAWGIPGWDKVDALTKTVIALNWMG